MVHYCFIEVIVLSSCQLIFENSEDRTKGSLQRQPGSKGQFAELTKKTPYFDV